MGGYSSLIVALGIISLASGYSMFRDRIPNGDNVISPCDSSKIWNGVGHLNEGGGGARNPFGVDFKANGLKWDATICRKDSDGDGKTNGEELGDPNCVWTVGATPTKTTGITHPGICDPIGSARCSNSVFKCPNPFNCPAINEPGVVNVDIRMPETDVPAQETTYICMNFELPSDQEQHIVATTPLIDNTNVMHHIIAYECSGVQSADQLQNELGTPYICDMSPERACSTMFGIWAFGLHGTCAHEKAGFLVGGNKGFKYAAFQIHWDNPQKTSTYKDASGMRFHMTPNLREFNAGIILIGQELLVIPPETKSHIETGSCAPMCTREVDDKIYVSGVMNHMHGMGRAQITEILRDDKTTTMIGIDEVYDYNAPSIHVHNDAIAVHPGDEVKTTCVFSSLGKNRTTYQGDATSDEMCYAFLMYYPKENFNQPTCTSYYEVPACDFDDGYGNGCNFTKLNDAAHPDNTRHYATLSTLCRVDMCVQECKDYLRVKKRDPCYSGTIWKVTKGSSPSIEDNPSYAASFFQYIMLMESCDLELKLEEIQHRGIDTGTASSVTPILSLLALAMSAVLLQ